MQRRDRKKAVVLQATAQAHAFGLRSQAGTARLNLSDFRHVLGMDADGVVEFEGACTIKDLLGFLELQGRTLDIIPDLEHLKMGGIVSGIGGGSGSWNHGAFHDSVVEADVLLADGSVVRSCSPRRHADLFYALPGSLGSLGYITRMKMATTSLRGKTYVVTALRVCRTMGEFLRVLRDETDGADFVDGTAFGPNHLVCVIGRCTDHPGSPCDNFKNDKIYWKALRDSPDGTTHVFRRMDYIYRFETDLYYTSANDSLPGIVRMDGVRRLVTPGIISRIKDLIGYFVPVEIGAVCADVMIPIGRAEEFWNFYCREVSLFPLYLCPARSSGSKFSFWTSEPILDFGVAYGVLPSDKGPSQENIRRSIEHKMLELGGRKLPYSRHALTEEEFWETRGGERSRELYNYIRAKYNAEGVFPSVYKKLC